MDHFTVPQFIEHKAKIVGPLTFQQFFYLLGAAAVGVFLWFAAPLYFFFMGTMIALAIASTLAFGKSGGRPLPVVFRNIVFFSMRPKLYLWKKKVGPPLKLIKAEKPEQAGPVKTAVPTIVGKSHLKDLSAQIEMRK